MVGESFSIDLTGLDLMIFELDDLILQQGFELS